MPRPFDAHGRFVSCDCPDQNCGGKLQIDAEEFGKRHWRCDGLTHETDDSELLACGQWHWDGEPDRRTAAPIITHE